MEIGNIMHNYNVSSIQLYNSNNDPKPLDEGDYHVYSKLTKTDNYINRNKSDTHINNSLDSYKDECRTLREEEGVSLPKLLENDKNIQHVLIELIKKQHKINCCDNVDLNKYVLKTSIPPCSKAIPDKYSKYSKPYKGADDTVIAPELHPQRLSDKFSIGYLALTIFIVLIIIMNVM